ncbi:recombinase family protein [Bacillus infantis]|uniref:recombinase family protein n=1 Tax=Bacillus infantis TaxID=324767 RepID=UPI00101B6D6A|nr:recombinase family protein [Bacillus infantis]RYI28278.1 recombinase family protein [Bacillus infantis]
MKKLTNIVGYLRVSTIEQSEEGFSLEAQEAEIRKHCEQHNLNLLGIFCDAGITGTSIEKRKEFQRMLSVIANAKEVYGTEVQYVMAWKLSRLSRNMRDLVNTLDYLERHNVYIKTVTDGIDTSTATGRSIIMFSGIMAEMERENIVSQCRLGMKQRARKGNYNGGKVLGYKSNSDKELEIDEDEAKIVREIFRMFTEENWGYKKIATQLNYMGYKTIKGRDWSINGIKQVIDNPIYVGFIRWGRYEFWNKKRRAGKSEDFVFVKGKHIPIITEETWEKTKQIREIRGKKPEKVFEGNFLLTGLLKCPGCGASMVAHKVKNRYRPGEYYRYYACGNYTNKGIKTCKTNLIKADYAEEYVLKEIGKLVDDPSIIKSVVKKLKKANEVDTEPMMNELKKIKKDLENIQAKTEQNLRLELENKISINILTQRMEFLEAHEKETKEKIFRLESEIHNIETQGLLDADFIQQILHHFNHMFEVADIKQRKQLLHSLIDRITVNQGDTTNERTISKITLIFEPQEVEALSKNKKFVPTYDTVPPD